MRSSRAQPVPDVGAIWAHYSHWVAQPASLPTPLTLAGFATTGDIDPTHSLAGRLLFTVGCHSALNVPDSLASTVSADDQQRLKDWAQAYSAAKAAVYVGNTGFGYGDTDLIDLSERLMDHFANNINSGGSIGEQWVRALHQYYAEPSNYDVLDEKVMIEANMYGLPFYDFGSLPPVNQPPTVTPPSHGVENGVDTAHLGVISANVTGHSVSGGRTLFYDSAHPDGSTDTSTPGTPLSFGTLSAFYRPAQPTVSRDVTVPGTVAHGAWIRSLNTSTTTPDVKPVKPFPLVFSKDELPATDYANIYFPANLVAVNRDGSFGQEHDTAVVNLGKFFPNESPADTTKGTELTVNSIGLDIGYSGSNDVTPPLITQVGAVKTGGTSFTAFVRVSDASGLARVAVFYTTGAHDWTVKSLTNAGGGLWTATFDAGVSSIRLDAEAQDAVGNVGYSFNKAVNFQSAVDTTAPSLLASQPLTGDTYTLNQQVKTSFDCSDLGGTASCTGTTDIGGPPIVSGGLLDTSKVGSHTFTITGTDLSGNVRTKSVGYRVLFGFSGFRPPISNPPILNIDNAGRTIPVKWGLTQAGGAYSNLDAVQAIWSTGITCPNSGATTTAGDVPIGLSGLKITGGDFQFNWATDRSWSGTCRRLYIRLSDGTTPYADFQLK